MNLKRHLYPVLLLLVLCVIGADALWKHAAQPAEAAAPPVAVSAPANIQGAPAAPKSAPAPAAQGYTAVQVASHASAQSCWTSISGSVYDLTAWINQHPGGASPILSLCGTDGTAAFMQQHGGQGRPASELATFRIGALAS